MPEVVLLRDSVQRYLASEKKGDKKDFERQWKTVMDLLERDFTNLRHVLPESIWLHCLGVSHPCNCRVYLHVLHKLWFALLNWPKDESPFGPEDLTLILEPEVGPLLTRCLVRSVYEDAIDLRRALQYYLDLPLQM